MFTSECLYRVHYALTDQMGVVYHGHYAQFYEIGRTEAIRELGFTYKDIESMGIVMPVVDIHMRFLLPAKYDDQLKIKTCLSEMPIHHKIVFTGEIYNQDKQLLNTGSVTLYFMDARSMRRCEMPAVLRQKLEEYF